MVRPSRMVRASVFITSWLLTVGSLLWASQAQAELTILPILRDRRASEALTQIVAERLQLLGEDTAAVRTTLSTAEHGCVVQSCLSLLAVRLQATRLLQGSVVSTAPRRYLLQVVLFHRSSGRLQKQESACDDCTDRQLQDLMASLAARLVDTSGRGPAGDRLGAAIASRGNDSGGLISPQLTERRQTELSEQINALTRNSEAQGRALDALKGSLDKARDGQERLRDLVDKTRGSADKTRESSERLQESAERLRQASQDAQKEARESAKKAQAIIDGLRQSVERSGEGSLKVQASVDGMRQSVERSAESMLKVQVNLDGMRQSVERVRDAVDSGRVSADASRAAAERLGPAFERITVGLDAVRQSAATAAEASQTGNQLATKALAGVEQLNALSGDLRTALTQVEPLRQAAEQTQTTAQANSKQSSDILLLVQQTHVASTATLAQAEQALTLVRGEQARRALPRGRKIGAGLLGAFGLLMTGATITLSALNGYIPDKDAVCLIGGQSFQGCPLDFSGAYIPLSAIAASFGAAGAIAFVSVPVRP